jgi:chromosome partitioning protein
MKIWCVANQKGGVGKTTTTVTLGGLLIANGAKTLLLDLDPHGSLSVYFGVDPEIAEQNAYTLFQQVVKGQALTTVDQIVPTRVETLHLLPASAAMATLDRQLGARAGMGMVISRALRELDAQYGHVIIDCPPMLGMLMINALAASDHLIIPVQTEYLALKGLDRMLHTISMIERSRNLTIRYTIVPTMFDRRTRASIESLRTLRERYSRGLWNAVVPIDTQFREASRAGVPLSLMSPRARGVQAYRMLLETLTEPAHEPLIAGIAS